jgi:hypothetical protein
MFTRQADGQPMCPQEFGLGGMSLRDYFAGQALVAIIPAEGRDYRSSDAYDHANAAYVLADAMLAFRERTEGAT